MRVDGQLSPTALWFKTIEKNPSAALDTLVDQGATGKTEPAKAAASNASFPTRMLAQLDSASILSLQNIAFEVGEDGKPTGVSATDEFLACMEKTPEERMRANILKSLGLTEEELESLPPERRQAVEDKIKDLIKERIVPETGLMAPATEP
jgi:hypothetical protein